MVELGDAEKTIGGFFVRFVLILAIFGSFVLFLFFLPYFGFLVGVKEFVGIDDGSIVSGCQEGLIDGRMDGWGVGSAEGFGNGC